MKLHPDYKEFIELLNKNKVEYLVIGGYAVVMYGYVRATGDIDFWVRNTKENADRIIQALIEFGFGSLKLQPQDFEKENAIIQLGFPPYRIDIVTSPEGISFQECFEKRVENEIDGVLVKWIDLENLKKNKLAAGRKKDIADIENLE